MSPPLREVREAHRRFAEAVAGLTNDHLAAPTALPRWTRGHVIAHVADTARAFARLTEHALRNELVDLYPGGKPERDAIIEDLAALPATELTALLSSNVDRLEAAWPPATAPEWTRPVRFRNRDLAFTVFTRWREVWIHLVDCDLGLTPADWPREFAAHAIDFLLERLPPGTVLTATDTQQHWTTGDGRGAHLTGDVRDLAAWLAGRNPTHEITGTPVELGEWPPHPPPDR